ncbi:hypothetical protein SCUP234_04213 [Seiridium cupressi]
MHNAGSEVSGTALDTDRTILMSGGSTAPGAIDTTAAANLPIQLRPMPSTGGRHKRQDIWSGPTRDHLPMPLEPENRYRPEVEKNSPVDRVSLVSPFNNPYSSALPRVSSATSSHPLSNGTMPSYADHLRDTFSALSSRSRTETSLMDLSMLPTMSGPTGTGVQPTTFPLELTPASPDSGDVTPRRSGSRSQDQWSAGVHCAETAIPMPNAPLVSPPVSRSGPPANETESDAPTLESDTRLNADEAFQTSLHIAAACGHEKIIDMLLAGGGTVIDEPDSNGYTALHVAAESGKSAAALRLLGYGANPNAENASGWTPVHLAVLNGSLEILEILIRHGGDPNKKAKGT